MFICLFSNPSTCHHLYFVELVTIQSAEENDFVISYSKKVWKETTNMWLGMYYDTDSKWGTPLEYCIMGRKYTVYNNLESYGVNYKIY